MNPAIKELEVMLLDCAKLDREINYFVDVVKRVTEEVRSAWHHLITLNCPIGAKTGSDFET